MLQVQHNENKKNDLLLKFKSSTFLHEMMIFFLDGMCSMYTGPDVQNKFFFNLPLKKVIFYRFLES